MDPELIVFLENCSEDIPIKYGIDICFYLPRESQDKSREKIIMSGFKTYYTFYTHIERKFLRDSFQKFVGYVVMAFAFLSFSYAMSGFTKNQWVYITLSQGVNIGGWVFLWEAISFLLFKRREIVYNIKTYERLAGASIYFKYDNTEQ